MDVQTIRALRRPRDPDRDLLAVLLRDSTVDTPDDLRERRVAFEFGRSEVPEIP
jgi:hypothetical protein